MWRVSLPVARGGGPGMRLAVRYDGSLLRKQSADVK